MIRKIKIYSLALRDIENGIEYYKLQQKGLGTKFEKQVKDTIVRIQKLPYSASIAYDQVGYKVLERFPYIILYEFDEANIYILRVFNVHQEPIF